MKWSELTRIATKHGWYKYRSGSRHDIYRHPQKDFEIQLERHQSHEVRPRLLQKLLKIINN